MYVHLKTTKINEIIRHQPNPMKCNTLKKILKPLNNVRCVNWKLNYPFSVYPKK